MKQKPLVFLGFGAGLKIRVSAVQIRLRAPLNFLKFNVIIDEPTRRVSVAAVPVRQFPDIGALEIVFI